MTAPQDAQRSRLPFDFSFDKSTRRGSKPRDDDAPFRVLVLADLGGSVAATISQRKPVRIDIDNFDAVFAKVAPKLGVMMGGQPLAIDFRSMDDFHPDALYARLAPFVSLRHLRSELADARQFPRVAEQLKSLSPATDPQPAKVDDEGSASDIERLLGRKPQAAARPVDTGLQSLVSGIVAPFVQADVAAEQKTWLAAMDTTISDQMRQLLHEPAFQTLEAAWRGIERLVREMGGDDEVQLFVLDASRDAMVSDLEATGGDLARSGLDHHLSGPATEAAQGHRWSLVVADVAIGPAPEDLRLLEALGQLSAVAGAALLAGATFDLVTDEAAQAAWTSARRTAAARSVGLVAPRVLLRLPYGAATDKVESFAFEEMAPRRVHAHYLWGNGAFALAALAAQAFREDAWDMSLAAQLDVADLPSHIYRDEDGEKQQQPCAELLMSEASAEALLDAGVMPLISWRNRDAARLLRWQSIADPVQPLLGPWSD